LKKIVVYVNDVRYSLLSGMTVQHALMAAGVLKERDAVRLYDKWGNEIGLFGAVFDGMRITTAPPDVKERKDER
jgi:hypothetical protein